MAKDKLLQALKRQACSEILAFRREAAERKQQLRKEYARRLRLLRDELKQSHRQVSQHDVRKENFRFKQQQKLALTQHRWQMAEKFQPFAEEVLTELWEQNQPDFLEKLLSELPELEWSCIRVSSKDLEVAHALDKRLPFTDAPELKGGLIAECSQRSLVVDCSLATLLDHLWPYLLPKLLERVADEVI